MDSKRRNAGRRVRKGKHSDGAAVAVRQAGVGGKAPRDHFGYPTRRAYRDAKYGEGYDQFRCGISWQTSRQMMWSGGPTEEWRYKRRGGILGNMHQIKQREWQRYLDAREAMEEIASAE